MLLATSQQRKSKKTNHAGIDTTTTTDCCICFTRSTTNEKAVGCTYVVRVTILDRRDCRPIWYDCYPVALPAAFPRRYFLRLAHHPRFHRAPKVITLTVVETNVPRFLP